MHSFINRYSRSEGYAGSNPARTTKINFDFVYFSSYKMYEGDTTMSFKDFKIQPTDVLVRFHKDDKTREFELESCDSWYAILTDAQYNDVLKAYKQGEDPEYETEWSLLSRFKVDDGKWNFVMISECPESGAWSLEGYCEENGIDLQSHIDSPIMEKVDREIDWKDEESWEEVAYTGCVDEGNYPHLLKTLYCLQHGYEDKILS